MAGEKSKNIKPDQQTVELRLRERERFLRTLIANLPGVVFRCRADQLLTKEFVSDGCFDLTGYRAEDLIGEDAVATWQEIMHPEDRERVLTEIRRLIEEGQPVENRQFQVSYRLNARDESIRHVRDRFHFVHDSSGAIVALEGFITDITDRTLADERVRESENRYKLLAENMRDLVCLHDLDGKYIYVSPSSKTLLGYTPDELVGTSLYDLINPPDVERIRDDALAELLKGRIDSIVVEYRMRDKTGEFCWFETMAQTVNTPDGEIVQLQTVSRDISKRKDADEKREKAQEELARLLFSEREARREADAARVELEHASRAKDEFLQMVSHEFRTPLTTIKTLVRVLKHDGESEADRQKHLDTIASETDRQIDMILNLLDVSRLEEGDVDLKHEPIDINRVLYSCDKIERPAAEAREQTLTIEQNQSLPKAAGDEKAIRRALCTIVENAIKYTPEGGMITVSARHVTRLASKMNDEADRRIAEKLFGDLPKQMDFSEGGAPAVEEIAVIACDTGRGILPADVPRIFQKFFRGAKPRSDSSTDGTPDDAAGKAETPGVGLGLYLAKRLIVALDGRITVNSQVGRGSCFTVFLPVWNENSHEKDTLDEYRFDENDADGENEKYDEETPARG
jgi:PAS domain S-box-containing protein